MCSDETWNDAVAYYFKQRWAVDQFHRQLVSLAHACHLIMLRMQEDRRPTYEEFLTHKRHGFTVDQAAFLGSIDAIAPHIPATQSQVVASVDDFPARLSGYIITEAKHCVGTGRQIGEALEQGRSNARRVLWRLEEPGAHTVQALFKG